jgi:probable HAF family extracellular repeat protein
LGRWLRRVAALGMAAAGVAAQASTFSAVMPQPAGYAGLLYGSLNNQGQLVGWASDSMDRAHLFLTGPDASGITNLGLGSRSTPAINDAGQLLFADHLSGPNGSGSTALGTLGGGWTLATALNNAAQVAGVSTTADGSKHVFLTGANAAGMQDLGTVAGAVDLLVVDLNEAGQLVGRATMADGSVRSFIGDAGGLHMLDWVDSRGSVQALNDAGQLLGNGADGRPFIANLADDSFKALAFLGTATGFNDAGQVVGYTGSALVHGGDRYAFATGAGGDGFFDLTLETAVDPAVHVANIFWIPTGINDRGQIAVMDYSKRTFLISAVPEPETWALALLGLAVVGVVARRGRRAG